MTSYNNPNDPNYTGDRDLRDRDRHDRSNFWPWVIGLLVLLAVGWIVIEAFDTDDGFDDSNAVPAAGEMRDDVGTQQRDNMNREVNPDLRDQTIGTERGGTSPTENQPQSTGANDVGNTGGGAP